MYRSGPGGGAKRSRYARRVDEQSLRSRSLWLDQLAGPINARPSLAGDTDVDVAIIGGGYSGLWSADALLRTDPALRVLVIEREMVGFGASGRNGGWCVGELAGGLGGAVATWGRKAGISMTKAIIDTVEEIGRVITAEGIECGFEPGGVLRLARTEPQLRRQRDEIDEYRLHGFGDDVLRSLSSGEATDRLSATEVLGGLHYAPGARVQPAQLVRGLAGVVERLGGTIVEHTAAIDVRPGSLAARPSVITDHGVVRADVVVRATEAYTRDLPGLRRALVPLYSLMVATEPLDASAWESIGLRRYETFADDRRMVIYGQRTTDDRIAFGGRGAPYRFGSGIDPVTESASGVHDRIAAALVELLPQLDGVEITHRWGGVLGVPRDWRPSVGLDRSTGLAWTGGYVGEGVAAANLAGRTIADLVVRPDSQLAALPWVQHRSPRWEPEPLRWAAINGARRLAGWTDDRESDRGRTPRLASVLDRIMG